MASEYGIHADPGISYLKICRQHDGRVGDASVGV